jgi:PAS domain S-box-containing protein
VSESNFESSRAYLAAIVESSDDAIISKDLNGLVRSFNAAAERLFGYRATEIIGRPITLLLSTERLEEESRILSTLRRGDRVDHLETVRVAKDGRRIDVSLSVSPIRDDSGQIVGAAKIVRDITERKRAAEALATQREWFRVTLQSIGDGIVASDPEGRVTFMNPVAERLTGWSSDEARGQPLAEVFHIVNETTRARVNNPAEKVIRTGVVVGLANHTVLIGRDGTEWPIADSAAPILNDEGRILGVVLAFHDVGEQRRAEQQLAEQREWFETTLESIGDGVIATDIRGHVVFMNPVAEHLTGWLLADARGRDCQEVFRIVNEQTRRAVRSPIARVLEEGTVVGLANHTLLIAADGTERPIDDSGSPIRDHADRIVGAVLVFRDVTERRRLELERQTVAQEREQLLESERTARAEAERANRVKDDFVAMVSHELRTPLGAILAWTHILQKELTNDTMRHGLDVIARSTRMQTQLIADLLDISRVVSGKLTLEVEPLEIGCVVDESIETLQHAANQKDIQIIQRRDRERLLTVADPARLRQVVWNLLSNAIKFTPAGGRVEVRVRRVQSFAEIAVTDTGMGVSSEDMPHLFERFRQRGPITTRRQGGLGLGLSIARHIVDLHGGTIRAASDGEDKGATFTVELPLKTVIEHTEGTNAAESVGRLEDAISLSGVTVLVVEDEADMRETIRIVLEGHGARVIATASAAEALEAVRQEPDIIISDIGLPDVDGHELISRIRMSEQPYARTPAVALTAFARPEDRRRALRVGFQTHIAKPFEAKELVATIASFADIARLRRNDVKG